jgi:transposase
LAAWLDEKKIPWALANPREVRDFAKAMGHRSKTDPIDAGVLVRFAEIRELEPRTLADPVLEKICRISRLCQSLQDELTRNRDRIEKAQADPSTPAIVRATLDELTKVIGDQIQRLEAEVPALIKTDDQLHRDYQLLRSIKSVGPKTARVLIAEIGEGLRWATASQLVSFAGLDVVLTESGKSTLKQPRISKKGNWRVRRALYLAALTASVHNPILAPYYRRLVARNVPKKPALVAVMRKLLHLCHGVIKHQRPFDPFFAAWAAGGVD